MLFALLSLGGGLVILTVGAELLIRGATSFARRMGLSALMIGLTVVSIGTSLPELVVSLDAALTGSSSVALGNVVGSNISNIALILGAVALVRPLQVETQLVRTEVPLLVIVSVLMIVLTLDEWLGRIDGLVLTAGIVAYLLYNVRAARKARSEGETTEDVLSSVHPFWMDLGLFVMGIAGLVGGAHLLVEGAVHIAESIGVRRIVIGLTVVAVGTSLPELATSIVAAHHGEGDIAIGNVVGSCIFNLLGILGVTATILPFSTASLGLVETLFMVGTAVAVLPLLRSGFTLGRWEGAFLLLSYAAYLAYLVVGEILPMF